MALNYTLDQLDLRDFYKTFCPKAIEYIFKCTWNVLQDRSHAKPQKSITRFNRTEIKSSIFFFFLIKKLEISYRKKNGENTNTWRLNNIPLRNQRINEEIKDKIRKHLEINVSETQIYKIYEMQEKQL